MNESSGNQGTENNQPTLQSDPSNDQGSGVVQASKLDPHAICELVLGEVEWIEADKGYVQCPGKHLHNTGDGHRDCRVYLQPIASLNCFHSTCKKVVVEKANELRAALASGNPSANPVQLTREEKKRIKKAAFHRDLAVRARHGKATLLKTYVWPLEAIKAQSPIDLSAVKVEEHWKLLLNRCFQPDDVIWIGDKYDSGEVHGVGHFKTRDEWLNENVCPGPLICPSAFKPGSISRSKENVVVQRALVVESDVLSKDEVGGIFNWLRTKAGIELMAIVDTGNKSLHGWFTLPEPAIYEELKVILPELGCDEKTLHPSQPVRLPGYPRGEKYQHLVWLGKEVA